MSASYAHTPVDETTLNVKLDRRKKFYDYQIKLLKDYQIDSLVKYTNKI